MKIESDGLIDLLSSDGGPLCPASMPPVHPSHAAMVAAQNAVYEATARDGDGEPATSELEKVGHAVSYSWRTSSRMRLYRDTASALSSRGVVPVEALYFRCLVCGLVLPAQRA